MTTIEDVKSQLSIKDMMLAQYPDNFRGNGQSRRKINNFICPYCEDRSGSSVLSDRKFYCLQCGKNMDVIDFVQENHGFRNFKEAFEECQKLTGREGWKPKLSTNHSPIPVMRFDHRPDLNQKVKRYYQNIGEAMPYFYSRAVTHATAHSHILGMIHNFNGWTYTFADGRCIKISQPRYSIPTMMGNQVICINMRRDDTFVDHYINNPKNRKQLDAMHTDFAEQHNIAKLDANLGVLLDAFFGPKYYRIGPFGIFNCNAIARYAKGKWHSKPGPYVLITEGEFDALSLDSLCYPVISAKLTSRLNIAQLVENIDQVFIIRDPDEAGEMYANKMLDHINSDQPGKAKVITPPSVQDVNEMAINRDVRDWLDSLDIRPTKRLRMGQSTHIQSKRG